MPEASRLGETICVAQQGLTIDKEDVPHNFLGILKEFFPDSLCVN
jgi:hypothetical protein